MLWERGGRFSQRHAGTGSSQLAAGEVTATLLGGCAHSKRSGRGARPLLPGPEHRETHPDSTEKAFNEPWSSCSQVPPTQSFNKYSAKRSGGLAGRQRAGDVTMQTTPEELSGHTTRKHPRTTRGHEHLPLHRRAHVRPRHTRMHDCACADLFGSLAWDLVFGAPPPGSEEWHRQLSRAQLGCTVV